VINHPALLDDMVELFAEMSFASPVLDSLRREILDIAALSEGLDSGQLRDQLEARGRAGDVRHVVARANRLRLWFIEPDAALKDVIVGFRQLLGRHRKTATLERELTAAEARLADDPTEENLQHLNEIREQLLSTTDEEASVEGFGASSGRPADQVV